MEASRAFGRGLGDLRVELAAAVESERLQERGTSLKAEIDNLLGAGARNDQDQQAGLLARLTDFGVEGVQTSIVAVCGAGRIRFGLRAVSGAATDAGLSAAHGYRAGAAASNRDGAGPSAAAAAP